MEISKGIEIVDTALFLKKEKILIMNDLHIGYEQALHIKGILVPRFQLKQILEKTRKILEYAKPKIIIINGDLKHVFGKILQREWKEVSEFLDFLLERAQKVVIVQGNHDPVIKPIVAKRRIDVVPDYRVGDLLIVHGDELVETDATAIIIGHEHPAVTIREGSKMEKFKCFLKGKWQKKELIAVPSFNPLVEGTDVLQRTMLSPFLQDVDDFEIFVVSKGEVFPFGKVKSLI
jgi:uncharacterized protein